MNVNALVIHKLEKRQQGNAKLTKAKKQLTITAVHQAFMSELKDAYYKKSNPIYGVFDAAADSFPYQKFIGDYLAGKITFLEFTDKAVTHFETIINGIPQATGGYVLFCDFETTDKFITAIVLNDKESYFITETLDISNEFILDIGKLDVANFVNCSKWQEGQDVYLSFTKGKKDVSNYFKTFIGCTDFTSAKESSENLKRALTDYLRQEGMDAAAIEQTKAAIFSYCERQMKKKEDIHLDFVSSLINQEEPEKFREFAAGESYQVSAAFKGHSSLRSLKYYSYKSKDLVIEFDSKLLGDKVIYDQKKDQLIIKQVPADLKQQLGVDGKNEKADG